MPEVKGFHHISAFTKSMEDNLYFYTHILGLRLVKQTVHQENFQTPHLFYGDYWGTPGTLLTFFVYPKIGKSYKNDHYYGTVSLSIPKGSLIYWKNRLEKYTIRFNINIEKSSINLVDPDGLNLELHESVTPDLSTTPIAYSHIQEEYQLLRIFKINLHTRLVDKERHFLKEWLSLTDSFMLNPTSKEQIQLIASHTDDRSRLGRGSIDHIALTVETVEDLKYFKERAEKYGYQVEKLIDRHYFTSLYVKSPSGLRIELATERPGFTIDESLKELGNRKITFKH